MLGMAIATDFVVSLVALALAADSVTREYRGQTWALLLLTGVSARYLVLGKWWASVLVLRRDFISVTILRVGGVCTAFVMLPILMFRVNLIGNVFLLLLAVVLIVLYSMLDAQIIAALGILGSLSLEQDRSGLGMVLRLVIVLIGWALVVLTVMLLWNSGLSYAFIIVPAVLVTVWALLLAAVLWLTLFIGVRARILPRHQL
jgi:hypothetical protein